MENHRVEELRAELNHLLEKQNEVLELRTFGGATDTDILEYEIRQDVIDEICNQLAKCAAAQGQTALDDLPRRWSPPSRMQSPSPKGPW
ncbi:MAG TPA: hypothetical protein VFF64_09620 [Candidatus Eremiobacteraceae bacterium]|nr:hypothetical protein [Candidatus Eremiobacteraceae bacterium]